MDDRPALRGVPDITDPDAHVAACAEGWARDTAYTWAVCAPTTGEMLGELTLTDLAAGSARVRCRVLPHARRQGVAATGVGAVARFASGALGLTRLVCSYPEDDEAAARLAARCGFAVERRDGGQVLAAR